jgi:hypothetical protein
VLCQRKAHATDEPKLTSFMPHKPAALHVCLDAKRNAENLRGT